jgi:hypothetical protein
MRLRPDRHKRLQFQWGFPFERGFRIAQSEASGDGWELPRTTRPSWWSCRGLILLRGTPLGARTAGKERKRDDGVS